METAKFLSYKNKIISNVSKAIVGKEDITELILISFICRSHVLLEDVPGTGKTMMLRAFSKSIGGDFKRIQFTPDLLPSDLTGINFYNQKTGDFEFRKGPLFSNIVLADEINRATPRTQSSLLEAMEERQISIDGETHRLHSPFMVMATQNPLESYGTFPLPEAQIDRFFMRLKMGYPNRDEELTLLARKSTADIIDTLPAVVTAAETEYVSEHFTDVSVSDDVAGYIMNIIEATRNAGSFTSGISTRGAIAFYKACQAKAVFSGRDYVLPEDVKYMAPFVLSHRLSSGGMIGSSDVSEYLMKLIEKIPVPLEQGR